MVSLSFGSRNLQHQGSDSAVLEDADRRGRSISQAEEADRIRYGTQDLSWAAELLSWLTDETTKAKSGGADQAYEGRQPNGKPSPSTTGLARFIATYYLMAELFGRTGLLAQAKAGRSKVFSDCHWEILRKRIGIDCPPIYGFFIWDYLVSSERLCKSLEIFINRMDTQSEIRERKSVISGDVLHPNVVLSSFPQTAFSITSLSNV